MRARLVDGAYAVGWALVRILPHSLAHALFRLGADLAYRRNGPGVRRLRANLRRVVGPSADLAALDSLTRRGLRSYARYWLEVFRLPSTRPERVVDGMRIRDKHILDRAHAAGHGVLLALPHMGNWDHAGAWLVLQDIGFTTVAERLEPARLYDRFVAYRESLGMEVLPLTGSRQPVFAVLADRLRAGRGVCLLADRDLSTAGIEVDFFGGRTRMPAGPALLALRTGAPLLPVSLWYAGPDWAARIHEPIDVPATGRLTEKVATMTQQLADVFAGAVAAHPQDWHMLQPLWLDDGARPAGPGESAAGPAAEAGADVLSAVPGAPR